MRLCLVNPNTSAETTAAMLAIAREAAPDGVTLTGETARSGALLITDEAALALAASAVLGLVRGGVADGADGVIVAAFGDPGLSSLRSLLPVPVTGIAEAGMAEAAAFGPFAVVTTTPDLSGAIARAAEGYGHGERFLGVRLTPGDPRPLMADPPRLLAALHEACRGAVEKDGASAVVIGGGPLAVAARALGDALPVPLVEPVPAAVRLAVARAQDRPLTW